MFKFHSKMTAFLLIALTSSGLFANTVIENAPACSMKNLHVNCEKGDQIKLDVTRTSDQRGVLFLNIKSEEALGEYILLYINNNKPEILKIDPLMKGAFVSLPIVSKLRSASKVHFKISMKKRNPIHGSLGQHHFEWLKRFGKTCG